VFETTAAQGTAIHVLANRLRLAASWPLPPGTRLKVWVGNCWWDRPFARIFVTSCRQRDGLWVVSYAFEGAPPADVLCALGHPHA
jgi:hypothetical protein